MKSAETSNRGDTIGNLAPSAEFVWVVCAMFAGPILALFFFFRRHRTLAAWSVGIGLMLAPIGLMQADASSPLAAFASLGFIFAFVALEALRAQPSVTGIYGFGHLAMIAIYIPIMSAYPSWFARLWSIISTPDNLDDVRTLLVCSVLGWGFGASGLFGLTDTFVSTQPFGGKPDPRGTPKLLVGIGVAAFGLVFVSKGGQYLGASFIPQSVAGIVSSVDYLYYVSLFASCFVMFHERKLNKLTVAWLVAAFVSELISGSKGRFFLFVLAPLSMIYAFAHRRVARGQLLAFLATIGFSVFVVFPILVNYRDDLSSGRAEVTDAVSALQQASERPQDDLTDKLLGPITGANTAEQVIAMTSIINARLTQPPARLLIRVGFFWIPRFAWPEKPLALSTNTIARASGRLGADDEETSLIVTGPAELYMYLGVFGGLLLVIPALFMRMVEKSFAPTPLGDAFQAGLVLYLVRIVGGFITSEFESSLTGLIQQFVVLAVLLWLHRRAMGESIRAVPA